MKNPLQSTLFLVAALVTFSIVGLIAVVAVSSQGIERIGREEDREIRETMVLIEHAYQLKVAIERQVVGLHGFAASGDDRLLRPWEEGHRDFAAVAAELASTTGSGEQQQLIGRLGKIEQRLQTYGLRLIALKRQRRSEQVEALVSQSGLALKGEAIALADQLIEVERAQVAHLHADVVEVESQVRRQLWLGAFISIPISLLLAASIAWRVIVPLRELDAASRAIAQGRLHVRVTPRYQDEFGEVARAFNTMASAVERTLLSLRESNEELVRVDRYKDDFLSMVTHELRTPLTAILGFARMLERGRLSPMTEPQQHAIAKVVGNASRMQALVNDLLDSSAIRQGRLELVLEPTPYRPLLDEAVAHVQALALQKHIVVTVEAQDDVAPSIDAARISQVMANLLSNALKFTPAGGRVSVRAVRQGDTLLTEVADNGHGIAEADLTQLFQPFSRLNQDAGGTGLGLSISRAIVDAHGGDIGVRSVHGQGSVFWFRVPSGSENQPTV